MPRIVHISDSHLGPTPEYQVMGQTPYQTAIELVKELASLPFDYEAVVHTGDISADKSKSSYELASKLYSKLPVPCLFVAGNHDDSEMMRSMLPVPGAQFQNAEPHRLSYAVQIGKIRYLILDAQPEPALDPQGLVPNSQISFLRAEAKFSGSDVVVLMHYPPFPIGSPWFDKNMTMINGELLHAVLKEFGPKLRAVLFGHMHGAMTIVRDGLPYIGVPSGAARFRFWPQDIQPFIAHPIKASFNIISFDHDRVTTTQYLAGLDWNSIG
ncbi:MAG: metallophosphoesterase [Oligoflexia bacterium]|nr:metallophosphoesterase [Oligoflexia bacterium]